MCLICHREPNVTKPRKTPHLSNAIIEFNSRWNDDGFGIAWRENNTLSQKKFGPAEWGSFELLLKAIDKDPAIEYVAHFRTATTGPACVELSHPFSYDDPMVGPVLVFHNGIINIAADSKVESDTSVFVEKVLSRIESCWWRNPAMAYLVGEAVSGSKLLIMTQFETVRLNENRWQKRNGIWFSTTPIFSTSLVPYNPSFGISGKGGDHEEDDYWDGIRDKWADEDRDRKERTKNNERSDYYVPKDGWYDQGHHFTPLAPLYGDGADESGDVMCDVCFFVGTFDIYHGEVYLNVDHDPKILLAEEAEAQSSLAN